MSRPILASISRQALQNNLKIVRQLAPNAKLWAVTKANAYGHGLKQVLPALIQSDGIALLNIEDAIRLRHQGWHKPILLLEGFFTPSEIPLLEQYQLTTCVHSTWQLLALKNACVKTPIDVYLKINNGMNRLGFALNEVAAVWQQLKTFSTVANITLMSHFAQADEGKSVMEAPLLKLEKCCQGINAEKSFANSAAILWHPNTHHQWVRPGIILYGASPTGRIKDIRQFGFKPVMTLESEIIATQSLQAGERVGYGAHYQATNPQRIGVVACGYADGYPRHAPTGTPISVDGIMTKIVGTVSMDMLMVDLTSCPKAGIGSRVQLWGDKVAIDDVARAAGTLGYELMCALAPRVPYRIID